MIPPAGVEDPISATFDLSDRVAQMAPVVRRMYVYTAILIALWIIIMLVLVLVELASHNVIGFLFVLGLLALGILAGSLLRRTDRFFRDFVRRHRAIRLVREADPVVKVPDGRTPIERLANHLKTTNGTVGQLLKEDPTALRYRVGLPASGGAVPFDLVLVRPGSTLWRTLGWGSDTGFAILARFGPDAPVLTDLRKLETDVLAAAPHLEGQVVRAILLRSKPVPLPEDVYEYAVGHPVEPRHRGADGRINLEIITENADGTYDFVPQVLGVP